MCFSKLNSFIPIKRVFHTVLFRNCLLILFILFKIECVRFHIIYNTFPKVSLNEKFVSRKIKAPYKLNRNEQTKVVNLIELKVKSI